jgi:hypothetical protein
MYQTGWEPKLCNEFANMCKDVVVVACLHIKTPEGHSGASLFCFFNYYIFISCIRPLLVSCLVLWTSPPATRQFRLWPQRLTQGTWYKNIWPLCQKHVTRLDNYPATLCILSDLCCNTRRCNFHRWSSGRETAPRCDNKATQNRTLLGVRPESYPTTPTHRSDWARDTTSCPIFITCCSVEGT